MNSEFLLFLTIILFEIILIKINFTIHDFILLNKGRRYLYLIKSEIFAYIICYIYLTFGNRTVNRFREINMYIGSVLLKIIGFSSGYKGLIRYINENGIEKVGNVMYFNYELFYGAIFNILLYIPFGIFFTALMIEKKIISISSKTCAIGVLLSIFTEVFQYITGRGWCDVDDIILNLVGCYIGSFIMIRYNRYKLSIKDKYNY